MWQANEAVRSRSVVVTFTERCHRSLEAPGFGTTFLLANGYDVLAIKNRLDDWYCKLQAEDLAALSRELSGYDARATYGSSMGAFAAIKFAKALNAASCVAISPVLEVRHDWDTRYVSDIAALERAGIGPDRPMIEPEEFSPEITYHVAFDPYCREDTRHADLLAELAPKHSFLKVRLGGHPVGPTLLELGVLSDYVLSALEDTDASAVAEKIARRNEPTDLSRNALARYLLDRSKLKSAYAVSLRALTHAPESGEAHLVHAQILARLGRMDEAVRHGLRAIERCPDNPYFVDIVADFLIRGDSLELAQQLLDDGVERFGRLDVLVSALRKLHDHQGAG